MFSTLRQMSCSFDETRAYSRIGFGLKRQLALIQARALSAVRANSRGCRHACDRDRASQNQHDISRHLMFTESRLRRRRRRRRGQPQRRSAMACATTPAPALKDSPATNRLKPSTVITHYLPRDSSKCRASFVLVGLTHALGFVSSCK